MNLKMRNALRYGSNNSVQRVQNHTCALQTCTQVVETQDEVVHVKVFSLKGESQFL
jgi:hypothetical protein